VDKPRLLEEAGAQPPHMWQLRVERELPAVLCARLRGSDMLSAMVRFRTSDRVEAVHDWLHTLASLTSWCSMTQRGFPLA
jgi:hypothetical protein